MQAKAWLGRLQDLLIEMAVNRSRRTYLSAAIASVLLPSVALASQREETLADNVASTMRRSVNNVSPARLVFSTPQAGRQWLQAMSAQLSRFIPDARERETILINVQYEAKRAGLDVQLILGLIEVESMFRRYAISGVGARGLMQVMPFWVRHIGTTGHNLFEIRTNLRYGCTILRYYIDRERGDITRALARYNGSLGRLTYPNKIYAAMRRNWIYNGAV